jgi:hypothetical protein
VYVRQKDETPLRWRHRVALAVFWVILLWTCTGYGSWGVFTVFHRHPWLVSAILAAFMVSSWFHRDLSFHRGHPADPTDPPGPVGTATS